MPNHAPPRPSPTGPGPSSTWRRTIVVAGCVYVLTTAIVASGILLGHEVLRFPAYRDAALSHETRPLARCSNWDGLFYREIATEGYRYVPNAMSNIAFFPAFPLLGATLSRVMGLKIEYGLLLAANLSCMASFIIFHRYASIRCPSTGPESADRALLGLALLPPGFFLRMGYTESLFLLLIVLVLYGIAVRWPLWTIAAVAGLATATRTVGVAMVPAVAYYAWRSSTGRPWRAAARLAYTLPLSCWGLVAFMAYQYAVFGEPLAFAKVHKNWSRYPDLTLSSKLVALATLEPFTSFFDPTSMAYWANRDPKSSVAFNFHIAGPFYFLAAVGLLALGWLRRWLTREESAIAAALLLIPYLSNSVETLMDSVGRYATVVITTYLVLGRLVRGVSPAMLAAVASVAGFMLGAYAAMFAAWYDFY